MAIRKIIRDTLQKKLFRAHKEKFATLPVPMCYRPTDTRRLSNKIDILGQTEKQILVLNDIVSVDIIVVEDALRAKKKSPWTLGYAMTIHSSQGLTISNTVVWIVDDRIGWLICVYLAVYIVRRINQLRRVVFDANDTSNNEIVSDDIIKN